MRIKTLGPHDFRFLSEQWLLTHALPRGRVPDRHLQVDDAESFAGEVTGSPSSASNLFPARWMVPDETEETLMDGLVCWCSAETVCGFLEGKGSMWVDYFFQKCAAGPYWNSFVWESFKNKLNYLAPWGIARGHAVPPAQNLRPQ